MGTRRPNPNLVKRHRSFSVEDLAALLGVHKNTIRLWRAEGLSPVGECRPALYHGEAVRDFLTKRNAGRKRPCPPGKLYCFGCREPRAPALGMVDFVMAKPFTGNLRAIFDVCGTLMHRRARRSSLPAVMPGVAIQYTEAPPRLRESPAPSLNCDSKELETT